MYGEVYRFADIAVALELLDEVEAYDPTDPEHSEYIRRVRPATIDADHSIVQTWCYLYNFDAKGYPRIKSGAWEGPQ